MYSDFSLSVFPAQIIYNFKNVDELTLRSPVPGKYSPYLWRDTVMTLSVV